MSSQNKHNLQKDSKEDEDRGEWREKGKEKKKCQSALQGHPNVQGWLPVGPRYDIVISEKEITAQLSTKCQFKVSRLFHTRDIQLYWGGLNEWDTGAITHFLKHK